MNKLFLIPILTTILIIGSISLADAMMVQDPPPLALKIDKYNYHNGDKMQITASIYKWHPGEDVKITINETQMCAITKLSSHKCSSTGNAEQWHWYFKLTGTPFTLEILKPELMINKLGNDPDYDRYYDITIDYKQGTQDRTGTSFMIYHK